MWAALGRPELAHDERFATLEARVEHRAELTALIEDWMATFRTDDEQLTRDIQRAHVNEGNGVYDQDHVVLEAQQKAIDKNPRLPFYNLNIDAGALWARKLIDGMLAREQGQPAQVSNQVPNQAAE